MSLPCLCLLLVLTLRCAAGEPLRPNLIWVMADDLGYGELGCYGQKVIQTPHLDRMAREGMRFTQFYAGATVCAPSRSVLMTGQHHGHTRVRGNAGKANPPAQALRSGDITVAGILQKAGSSEPGAVMNPCRNVNAAGFWTAASIAAFYAARPHYAAGPGDGNSSGELVPSTERTTFLHGV